MKPANSLVRGGRSLGRFLASIERRTRSPKVSNGTAPRLKIGLALGGGFARGIAHAGILKVFEQHGIAIDMIAGVSAGAIAAAAYASGATPDEIRRLACSMRFADVAKWTISRMGLMASERMSVFLMRLLKCYRFEEMRIPLAISATDLRTALPVLFQGSGDVLLPIRASCSYPGLFQPVRYDGTWLVDGAISMEIPAQALRSMGATHVISVHLPMQGPALAPSNMFQVVNRCFQILHGRTEHSWRSCSDLVIEPDVRGMSWDAFHCGDQIVAAGEEAALAAVGRIRGWTTSSPNPLSEPSPQLLRAEL